jgi:hypothetical protein
MTWSRPSDPRNFSLVLACAAAAGAVAVVLRDHYDWEETAATAAFVAACVGSGLASGAVAFAWRRRGASAVAHAVAAAALVPPLLVLYYLVRMYTTADYS